MSLFNNYIDKRKVIIDRYSNPKNKGKLNVDPLYGYSERCSDKLSLYIEWDQNKVKKAKAYTIGCAVFISSVDLFLDNVKNKTKEDLKEYANNFNKLIEQQEVDIKKLGLLVVFENVKTHLNRIDCAKIIIKTIKKL